MLKNDLEYRFESRIRNVPTKSMQREILSPISDEAVRKKVVKRQTETRWDRTVDKVSRFRSEIKVR